MPTHRVDEMGGDLHMRLIQIIDFQIQDHMWNKLNEKTFNPVTTRLSQVYQSMWAQLLTNRK